jgi:DNA-directed RNA polymerase
MCKDLIKYPAFWLPITMDFRGRCYTSTEMLSPQGSDFDKALCRFKVAKPYTEDARYWMKIQIANLFGEDKVSFSERIQWFDSNEKELRKVALDPIANQWWSDSGDDKKKWQLLASILDYFREDGMNQVAVQMDGSCNGIQHWSAIGRDEIGAKATNLLPSSEPCDLYEEVAISANKILQAKQTPDNEWIDLWKEQGVSRKCAKRPCMTYPYGVTLRGCVDALKDDGHCDWAGDGKAYAAQCIGKVLMDEAIPSVVSASYQFMAWAKDIARQVNKHETYLEWTTPIGTKVKHNYYEEDIVRLDVLNRRVNIQTVSEDNPRLSTSEQLSGIAPNFIHSLDASHMLLTINAMWDDGIQDFNMIHDSFGCHASDVTRMHKHIREQFVWMYTTFNPALDLARSAAEQTGEEIIFPPEGGNLDISKVLEAPYFFA